MPEIMDLLYRMSGAQDGNEAQGSKTVSWSAYREAEQANSIDHIDAIMEIVQSNDATKLKKEGFELLGFILKNTKNESLATRLLTLLPNQKDQEENLYSLLIALWESGMAYKNHIEEVIFFIDDDRQPIRNIAIRVLSKFDKNKKLALEGLTEVIAHPYDEYDLKYAQESLQILRD